MHTAPKCGCSLCRGVGAVLKGTGPVQNIDCCSAAVGLSLCFYILNFQLLCKFCTTAGLLLEKRCCRRSYIIFASSSNQVERLISVTVSKDFRL